VRKDKGEGDGMSVEEEIIEMNRIAMAKAAKDAAVKDAHIAKKKLVEAAIEKVKEQITTH